MTPRPASRAMAMAVLVFASFMDLLDTTVVNVALPAISRDVGADPAELEWTVGGYALAFAVVLISGGRLGDIYGRRRVFVVGVVGFTAASLLAAVAPEPVVLVAARLVQGAFAALMVPQVLASVQALFTPPERAPVYGLIGATAGLAAVAGPLVGGSLVSADVAGLGWRAIFLLNVPIGIVLVVAALRWVPDTRSSHPLRLDPRGTALVTAALGLLVFGLVEGRQAGWPAWIWTMLAASPVVLVIFVVDQRRRAATVGSPLVPMTLFAGRGFSAGVITQFAFTAAMGALFLILALYLQSGLGFTALAAGLVLMPFALAAFVGSGIGVPLAHRLGKPMIVFGALLQTGAALWTRGVVASAGDGLSGWDLTGPMAVAGLGLGLLVIPLVDLALAEVDVRDAGSGSGVFSTFQQVGAAVGVAVVGVVFFDRAGAHPDPTALREAFTAAAWVSVAGYALCACAATLLPRSAVGAAHAQAELEPSNA